MFDTAQVVFSENRFYFKELDVNALKIKHHNKVPMSVLRGVKRPQGVVKRTREQVKSDFEEVKMFFNNPSDSDQELVTTRKRLALPDTYSPEVVVKRAKPSSCVEEDSLDAAENEPVIDFMAEKSLLPVTSKDLNVSEALPLIAKIIKIGQLLHLLRKCIVYRLSRTQAPSVTQILNTRYQLKFVGYKNLQRMFLGHTKIQ